MSVVVEEGGEVRTVNVCQHCYNEQVVQQGKPRLNSWQWRAVGKKTAHRGRVWKIMRNEQFVSGMWEYFISLSKREEAKKILEGAARERQEGIQGQWQPESPFREVLEQVRGNADMGCGHPKDAATLLCNEERQLGRIQRKIQERRKVIGVDPRKNTRSSRESQRMTLDVWALCKKF